MSAAQYDPSQPLPPPVTLPLIVEPDHDCPYLPGRTARMRLFASRSVPPDLYHDFMDAGFRRSGVIFYQPICAACSACRPIRVPVDRFELSKSQRRCLRTNSDVVVEMESPRPTDEKYELYRRYLAQRHNRVMDDGRDSFESFLYDSPVNSVEFVHRDPAGRLLGVGICDLCPRSLSSVYFYFDPDEEKRGLGTFSALVELDQAKQWGVPYYYLGYYIEGCQAMEYKRRFRPSEVMDTEGHWRLV